MTNSLFILLFLDCPKFSINFSSCKCWVYLSWPYDYTSNILSNEYANHVKFQAFSAQKYIFRVNTCFVIIASTSLAFLFILILCYTSVGWKFYRLTKIVLWNATNWGYFFNLVLLEFLLLFLSVLQCLGIISKTIVINSKYGVIYEIFSRPTYMYVCLCVSVSVCTCMHVYSCVYVYVFESVCVLIDFWLFNWWF